VEITPTPEEDPMHKATYEPSGTEVAVIETPKGVIKFEFYFEDAPNHVASFIELADSGLL
jgi:peptidyl-prolyl cis-trans isomerase B (cyclophilin B)